jgi:hypothetical protein
VTALQAHRTDLEARREAHLVVVHLGELERSAAEIAEQRPHVAERDLLLHRELHEARLLGAVDRLELDAGLAHLLEQVGGVLRVARRGGHDGAVGGDVERLHLRGEVLHRPDAVLDRALVEAARHEDALAHPHRLAVLGDHRVRAGLDGVDDEQARGVGSDVDGGEAGHGGPWLHRTPGAAKPEPHADRRCYRRAATWCRTSGRPRRRAPGRCSSSR